MNPQDPRIGQLETKSYILNVTIADGKYTIRQSTGGRLEALRYGEPWRCCSGDSLIYQLAATVQDQQEQLIKHKSDLTKANARIEELRLALSSKLVDVSNKLVSTLSAPPAVEEGLKEALKPVESIKETGENFNPERSLYEKWHRSTFGAVSNHESFMCIREWEVWQARAKIAYDKATKGDA